MEQKITLEDVTPEQWKQIDKIKERWLVDEQITQWPDDEIIATVREMLAMMDAADREIHLVHSPQHAQRIANAINGKKTKLELYCGLWWNAWAGWYEAAQLIGVKFDKEKYDLLRRFCRHCPVWMYCDKAVYILRRPTEIHWDDDGFLHNDAGPSVRYCDEFSLWTIHGVAVDEQIVMHPETQTISQITGEENAEVKRIRIERFGWERFLSETHAVVLDYRRNDIELTDESLMEADGMRVLVGACPSTGDVYWMEVDDSCSTCQEAQDWLRNKSDGYCLGAS